MKLWRNPMQRPPAACVATVGTFDGLHLGHQQIIGRVVASAEQRGLSSLVVLFEPQPKEYLLGETAPARLMKLTDKLRLLAELGVNEVLCLRFNRTFAAHSAEAFVQSYLLAQLRVAQLVVGEDVCFGHDRVRDVAQLRDYGIEIEIEPSVMVDGERVSSTRVRACLQVGDLAVMPALLGREFSLSGRVCYGAGRGRQLGFPTANIRLAQRSLGLLRGVYLVKVLKGDELFHFGVANIGVRPTVAAQSAPWLEVHLFDWAQPLYGCKLEVVLLKRLRDEQKFDSLAALVDQIGQDVQAAKQLANKIDL